MAVSWGAKTLECNTKEWSSVEMFTCTWSLLFVQKEQVCINSSIKNIAWKTFYCSTDETGLKTLTLTVTTMVYKELSKRGFVFNFKAGKWLLILKDTAGQISELVNSQTTGTVSCGKWSQWIYCHVKTVLENLSIF